MKKHNKLYTYNEMGHVIKKGLGYVSPTAWLQNLDMRYNIRGQLLSINNSKLTSDTGKTSSDANDVFGMRILYDQLDANVGNTPSHNGKVSAVKWMSVNAGGAKSPERSFKYSYDQVDRYTGSAYAERATTATGSFGNNIGGFDEYGITYDPNGNLLTLKRNSSSPGATTHHQIDSLTYSYSSVNGNQLTNVTDGTDSLHTDAGFRNLTGSTSGYMFDPEGNLKKDYKKGITNISYNVLNRTDTLQISATQYIIYTYDAGGNLIRKQAYKSGTTTQITDYIDGFVYNNTSGTETLAYFPMPEGRVLYNASTFTQEYIITDPQGNARVSFQNVSGAAKVFQENSYYATGLIMPNSPVATPTTPNKQLYNGGSEWQNDYSNLPDYYQTFNRNYDAAIGRIGADPVAESAESMTPYQYAGDNPVMNNDPMGDLQQTPSWWRASGQPQTVFSPTSDAFDGGDPSYDMYSITGSYGPNGFNGVSGDGLGDGGVSDPGFGGGGGGGDMDASLESTNVAGDDRFATTYHYTNGTVLQVPDNSNANYDVSPDGSIHFAGYTNQGGLDKPNYTTNLLFLLGYFQGMTGVVPPIEASITAKRNVIGNRREDHIGSGNVTVTFSPGADNTINTRLEDYFQIVMARAAAQGINSVNISSTTNHPSNRRRSAHTVGRAVDINFINGIHVSTENPYVEIMQNIILNTPGWMEDYGPLVIQRMYPSGPVYAPWARDIPGGHYDHIHISVP